MNFYTFSDCFFTLCTMQYQLFSERPGSLQIARSSLFLASLLALYAHLVGATDFPMDFRDLGNWQPLIFSTIILMLFAAKNSFTSRDVFFGSLSCINLRMTLRICLSNEWQQSFS